MFTAVLIRVHRLNPDSLKLGAHGRVKDKAVCVFRHTRSIAVYRGLSAGRRLPGQRRSMGIVSAGLPGGK